jgi:hypothetical protein
MFDRVRADVYVLVDGDDTYPAEKVHELIAPILAEQADMVVGARMATYAEGSFRPLHVFGNRLVCWLVNRVGKAELTDILSGYRAFSDRVVRRVPVLSTSFEVETDMTIQTLYYRMRIIEVQVPYGPRPAGSVSKLNTFTDGFRVLWKIVSLFRAFRPLAFFSGIGTILLVLGLLAGIPPIVDYFTEPGHYVHHVPLAILATGLIILSFLSFVLGILLHATNYRLLEIHNVLTRERRDRRP